MRDFYEVSLRQHKFPTNKQLTYKNTDNFYFFYFILFSADL